MWQDKFKMADIGINVFFDEFKSFVEDLSFEKLQTNLFTPPATNITNMASKPCIGVSFLKHITAFFHPLCHVTVHLDKRS